MKAMKQTLDAPLGSMTESNPTSAAAPTAETDNNASQDRSPQP
jgi:hypothetical protein